MVPKFKAAKNASPNIKTAGAGVPVDAASAGAPGDRIDPTFDVPKSTSAATPSAAASSSRRGKSSTAKAGKPAAKPAATPSTAPGSLGTPARNQKVAGTATTTSSPIAPGASGPIAPMAKSTGPLKKVIKRVAPDAMKENTVVEDKTTLERLIYDLAEISLSKGASSNGAAPAGAPGSPAGTPAVTDVDQIANLVGSMSGKDLAALKQKLKGVI